MAPTIDEHLDDSTGIVESVELGRPDRSRAGVDIYTTVVDIEGDQRDVEIRRPRLQGMLDTTADLYLDGVRDWAALDDHEGILSVLDWGVSEERPWVVTEQMGETLNHHLADGPLGVEETLTIVSRCLQTLAHSHEQRVNHLALTPARIGVHGDRPVIAATKTGTVLTTEGGLGALAPAYAAPEQFDPDRFGEPDQRTDIYRLGVICYEMLTGERPYSGSTAALVTAVTDPEQTPAPPSEHATVPTAVDDILIRALATNPEDRYTTAEAFETAIRELEALDIDAGDATEASDTEWQQFGGRPAQTRHAPGLGPSPPVEQHWTVDTGYHEVQSAPVVADDTVYFGGNDDAVHAVDIDSGTEQWAVELPRVIDTSPAVTAETVFVTNDEMLYALDRETGEKRWTFATGELIRSSPTVVDDTVVFGSDDEHVYALDTESGTQQWHYGTDGPVQSSPAIADGTVYIGSNDRSLHALDLETGEQRWRCQNDLQKIKTAPAVRYDTVYVTAGGTVHAIDADSGEHRWQFAPDSRTLRSPAVDAGSVFVSCEYAGLYALDADTGDKQWVFAEHDTMTAPAVTDGIVYVANEQGTLFGVATDDGNERWSFDLGEGATSAPGLGETDLFIGGEDGSLVSVRGETAEDEAPAFGTASGDITLPAIESLQSPDVSWQTAGATPGRTRHIGGGGPQSKVVTRWKLDPDATLSPPTLDRNGTVYVGDERHNLLAIDSESGDVKWRADAATEDEREIVTDGERVYAIGPTYPNDKRRQATEGGELLSVLDAASGETHWQYAGTGRLQTPTVAGAVVYVCDEDGIRGLATDTGELLWETDAAGDHAPVVGYGTVYLAGDGTLTALDAGVGTERWSVECPRFVAGQPALAADQLYLASDEGDVIAFDAETGEEVWVCSLGDEMTVGVAVDDDTVYAASANGLVTALDVQTGEQRWQHATGEPLKKSLAVAEGVLYVSTRETMYALDTAEGTEQWQYRTSNAGYMHAPVVGSNSLTLVDEDRTLRSLVPRE